MKILRPIKYFYNFRIGIIKMFTEGANDVNSMKLEKLKNDFDQLKTKDTITEFEILMKYKKTLRRTKILTFFIAFGFITSIGLTLAGTNKIDFFDSTTLNTPNIIYCAVIFFLQSIIYIVKTRESTIKEKYYNHYWGFKIAQYFIVSSSIYYNFRFFMMYFQNMNSIEIIITLFICAGLDITTINLIALKNDMKNNVMSYKKAMKKKDITLQEKKCNESTLQNSLHYIEEKKDVMKNKKTSLQTEKESFHENNENTINSECNECNDNVTNQEKDNTLHKKLSLQKEKCNENNKKNVMNSLQNSLQNSLHEKKDVINSLHENKNVMKENKCNESKENNSLNELSKKIDEYIILKYRIDDLISVKEIKEKFSIGQQRKWAKIISLLESAKIINGRLRRIQTSKKDNIKRVK